MPAIAFAPLAAGGSPDTVGDGLIITKSGLVFGSQTAVDYGIIYAPAFSVASSGATNTRVDGAGACNTPLMLVFGTNATSSATITGHGIIRQQGFTIYAIDSLASIPNGGSGVVIAPLFTVTGIGRDGNIGNGIINAKKSQAFGFEVAGTWGIVTVPDMRTAGMQVVPSITNYFMLQQSPGVMSMVASPQFFTNASDILTVGETLVGYDLPTLIERINLTGSPLIYATLAGYVSDRVSFGDAVNAAWLILLQENMQLAGVVAANPIFLGALVDTLHAIGLTDTRLNAVAALSAALTMENLIASGWSVQAMDSVAFNESMQNTARLIGALVDSAAMTAMTTNTMRLTAVAADTFAIANPLSASALLKAFAKDEIVLYATIRLGDTEYAGWAINTDNKAASQYTNTKFDSFAVFQGRSFGAGAGGVYEMTGGTDSGVNIPASLKTGLMNFGTGKMKRVPDVFIGYRGNGKLVLKVITTSDTGTKVEDWYQQEPDSRAGAVREGRFKVGRGLKSLYWQFEIINTAGNDLELSEVALRPLILDRRT